jgi:L-lactate dehydrogenase (cytochrome)
VVTVDTPVLGRRERDVRNGLVVPPRITVRNVADMLRRVRWLSDFAFRPRPTFGNFVGVAGVPHDVTSLAAYTTAQFSPAITLAELDWFRSLWRGALAVQGIMSGPDARLAVDHGADLVVVSNHGGRQCDGLAGAIEVLPEVVDAVGDRTEVILDGGVRRGADVVKAVALGARACMVGRANNSGLAAGGQPGVERALDILATEVDRCLALLGCPRLADLDRSVLRPAGPAAP